MTNGYILLEFFALQHATMSRSIFYFTLPCCLR